MGKINLSEKTFKGKLYVFAFFVAMSGIILTTGASAATLTVDDSGGANYVKIQDAINAASAGDTILVYSGSYNDYVGINKQLILKGVDNGGGKPIVTYVIGDIFALRADGVTVDGFEIVNAKGYYVEYATGIGVYSSNNTIRNNTISNNEEYGIYMANGNNNRLENNILSNNGWYGIIQYYGTNNILSNNSFLNNKWGLALYSTNDNTIYNNIFNNTQNIVFWNPSVDIWNIRQPGTNIVGGPYLGGNFWANPEGSGFSQMCTDNDNDGICDSAYSIDSGNVDYLPLTYKPSAGGLLDDFDDNSFNPSLWSPYTQGTGPSISVVNQRVEITLPANSKDDNSSMPTIAGRYSSRCTLIGDFDIQVDYELLDWPDSNGVRVGLGVPGGMTERVSFGPSWDYPYQPREVYLTHFADGVFGITETSNRSGKLRAVRTGSDLSGYYFNNSNWNLIRKYATSTTSEGWFTIDIWSANSIFKSQNVRVAFDNVIVNRGKLACSDTTPPITTPVISGTAGQNGWYTSDVQISLTAEDTGGSGISRIEYRYGSSGWITYTAPIAVNSEGTTVIYYRSRDRAQNTESAKEIRVNVDKTQPVIVGSRTPAPNANSWNNVNVTANFECSDGISGIERCTPDKVVSTDGASQFVTGEATDNAGNSASTTISGINIDKTPPDITINVPTEGAEYLLNQIVIANWAAIDHLSGVAQATGTVPDSSPAGTGTPGAKIFTVNASDNINNTADKTVTYYVRYAYSGILEPINVNGSSIFNSNKNSFIPVKFQLQDATGGFAAGAVADIYRTKISDNITGTINEEVYTHEATPGNRFIYNSTTNEYVFNLDSAELSIGTWRIEIRLDDGTSKYVDISVK